MVNKVEVSQIKEQRKSNMKLNVDIMVNKVEVSQIKEKRKANMKLQIFCGRKFIWVKRKKNILPLKYSIHII